jgi:hypothetical protein
MTSSISSISSSAGVEQYPAPRNAPPLARAATASGDTVALSDATQRALAASKQSAPQPLTLGELVRNAANGDISALARLVMVG